MAGFLLVLISPAAPDLIGRTARAADFQGLGDLPGGSSWSGACGVSADGSIIVGRGGDAIGAAAFVWDEIRGMQNLQELLVSEFGLTNLSDWHLQWASAISADGQVIVGNGINPSGSSEAWRAYLDGVTRCWIGANNNSWDQPGNWTKWGKPGPQTTVVINPDSSFTVAGPADEASVDSLTLGTCISGVATLTLDGPCLNVTGPINVQARGKLEHNAGRLSAGEFYNAGWFNQSLGSLVGVATFENSGTAVLGGYLAAGNALENQGDMTIQADAAVEVNNAGLLNVGALTLEGGMIAGMLGGGNGVTNDGSGRMTARGTISTTLTNIGVLELTGTLSVEGASTNWGRIVVGSAHSYRTGGEFTNAGIVELDGGSIAAAGGSLVNHAGGLIQGRGSISAPASNAGGLIYADEGLLTITNLYAGNTDGGELRVGPGSTMNVFNAFASTGLITLEAQSARFGGGTRLYIRRARIGNGRHRSGRGLERLYGRFLLGRAEPFGGSVPDAPGRQRHARRCTVRARIAAIRRAGPDHRHHRQRAEPVLRPDEVVQRLSARAVLSARRRRNAYARAGTQRPGAAGGRDCLPGGIHPARGEKRIAGRGTAPAAIFLLLLVSMVFFRYR